MKEVFTGDAAISFQNLGIQHYDDMTGINWSKLSVMISEIGLMTNEHDDLNMADGQFRISMEEGIANGIDHILQNKKRKKEYKLNFKWKGTKKQMGT